LDSKQSRKNQRNNKNNSRRCTAESRKNQSIGRQKAVWLTFLRAKDAVAPAPKRALTATLNRGSQEPTSAKKTPKRTRLPPSRSPVFWGRSAPEQRRNRGETGGATYAAVSSPKRRAEAVARNDFLHPSRQKNAAAPYFRQRSIQEKQLAMIIAKNSPGRPRRTPPVLYATRPPEHSLLFFVGHLASNSQKVGQKSVSPKKREVVKKTNSHGYSSNQYSNINPLAAQ
jgi:hypothetical protein